MGFKKTTKKEKENGKLNIIVVYIILYKKYTI